MATNQPSSSSSFTYDVFLSFRGEDTRNGFTGSLWKALNDRGICTFIDDQLLPKGPALLKVFSKSRVAIIVFSENYASSSYCLDELAFILDNFQQNHNNKFIFPIFYNINPSDVLHQSGTYGKAFLRHEARFGGNSERVVKWRTALTQVANLSGWHFSHRYPSSLQCYLLSFSSPYVLEFFILVYIYFFVANKSLDVQNLLILVPKVKIRRKICSFRADFPANFDFMD
jgi:hypothetical protein